MRLSFVVGLLLFASSSAVANETLLQCSSQNKGIYAWELKASRSRTAYGFINNTDIPWHVSVFVNPSVMKHKIADRVILECNGDPIQAIPGQWTSCDLSPYSHSRFYIPDDYFHNGADGSVEV